jgi:hypothetical protein
VVVDLHRFDEAPDPDPDPDPYLSEKWNPDPHQSEKRDPDPHHSVSDPQIAHRLRIIVVQRTVEYWNVISFRKPLFMDYL